MKRLTDYASDTFSQFGEDGCIAHIFHRIGEQSRVCVEFGAGDGLSCSNTARLWRSEEWSAVLVEVDEERFAFLQASADGYDTICVRARVTPQGPYSIDTILADLGIDEVDFLSIDIDGDDYMILAALQLRPRVICIEFNPTIPPHICLRPSELGGTFGASLRSIVGLAHVKGYRFIGATHCNAFLVADHLVEIFAGYETNLQALFPLERYTYAVTDYNGKVVLVGEKLPWGARTPCVEPLIGDPTQAPTDDVAQICRSFEARWGTAVHRLLSAFRAPTPEDSTAMVAKFLARSPNLVCVDLTNDQPGAETLMVEVAESMGYQAVLVGRVLGLRRSPQ